MGWLSCLASIMPLPSSRCPRPLFGIPLSPFRLPLGEAPSADSSGSMRQEAKLSSWPHLAPAISSGMSTWPSWAYWGPVGLWLESWVQTGLSFFTRFWCTVWAHCLLFLALSGDTYLRLRPVGGNQNWEVERETWSLIGLPKFSPATGLILCYGEAIILFQLFQFELDFLLVKTKKLQTSSNLNTNFPHNNFQNEEHHIVA